MCGRARCTLAAAAVAAAAGVPLPQWEDVAEYQPNPNIHPGNRLPVLTNRGGDGSSGSSAQQPSRKLQLMSWGLVPSFTKAGEKLNHFRMFNCRVETMAQKGVFSRLSHKRCVVFADGFYEWREVTGTGGGKTGKAKVKGKVPYYVCRADGKPLAFAALYDSWHGGDSGGSKGEKETEKEHCEQQHGLRTFTILTQSPQPGLSWLHDRQPVMLCDSADMEEWLDPALTLQQLQQRLAARAAQPKDAIKLTWHACHPRMNVMSYNEADAGAAVSEAEATAAALAAKTEAAIAGRKRKREHKAGSGSGGDSGSDGDGDADGDSAAASSDAEAEGGAGAGSGAGGGSILRFFGSNKRAKTSNSAAEGVRDTKDPVLGRDSVLGDVAAATGTLPSLPHGSAAEAAVVAGATSSSTSSSKRSKPVDLVVVDSEEETGQQAAEEETDEVVCLSPSTRTVGSSRSSSGGGGSSGKAAQGSSSSSGSGAGNGGFKAQRVLSPGSQARQQTLTAAWGKKK